MDPLKPKSSKLKAGNGFTLLETIIYVALLSVMTSFVMVVFYQLIGGSDQHRNRVEVDQEANFMMQKIVWALVGAQAINQPTGGATSTSLSINRFNYGQNPVVFDIGASNLRISKASGTPVILGSSRVFLDQLLFEHLPETQGAPEGVKVTIKLSSSNIARPTASTTLENTIYLR